MNAEFKMGKVKVGTETAEVLEKDVELITLSGGFLGKDDFTRPVTDEDRHFYKEEYAAFKASLLPSLPSASAGVSSSAAAAGADAAGAGDTKPPSAG